MEEFQLFLELLEEPIRTIALVCVCFGLRISECLALEWSDVDWLNGKHRVARAIVRQQGDDVKAIYSGRLMSIDAAIGSAQGVEAKHPVFCQGRLDIRQHITTGQTARIVPVGLEIVRDGGYRNGTLTSKRVSAALFAANQHQPG